MCWTTSVRLPWTHSRACWLWSPINRACSTCKFSRMWSNSLPRISNSSSAGHCDQLVMAKWLKEGQMMYLRSATLAQWHSLSFDLDWLYNWCKGGHSRVDVSWGEPSLLSLSYIAKISQSKCVYDAWSWCPFSPHFLPDLVQMNIHPNVLQQCH